MKVKLNNILFFCISLLVFSSCEIAESDSGGTIEIKNELEFVTYSGHLVWGDVEVYIDGEKKGYIPYGNSNSYQVNTNGEYHLKFNMQLFYEGWQEEDFYSWKDNYISVSDGEVVQIRLTPDGIMEY